MHVKLKSGIIVNVNQVSNMKIFEDIAALKIPVPQPPIVTLDDGNETINTFDPVYADAITIYKVHLASVAFDVLLANAVEVDSKYLNERSWKSYKRYLENQFFFNKTLPESVSYLRYFALQDSPEDKMFLTQNAILHELAVLDIFNSLSVSRDGYDIKDVQLKHGIKTGIDYQPIVIEGCQLVNPLDEMKACKDNNINWLDWYRCNISLKEKATIIGLWRLNKLIDSHNEDAVQIESEKKSKRNK